jgi:hypothetical protein
MANFSDIVSPLTIGSISIGGGSNVTLTTAQTNAGTLIFTGTLTANVTVYFPARLKIWSVVNKTTGAFTVTLAMTGGTATTTVAQGYSREFYCDGTTGVYVLGSDISNSTATSLSTTGLLTINNTGSSVVTPFSNTVFQIAGLGSTRAVLDSYSNSSSAGPVGTFQTRGSRGTPSAPLALQSGDVLASFSGHGYGATGFQNASTGLYKIVSEGTFSDTSMPTALTFSTTVSGSIVTSEAGRFNNRGALLLGTTTDDGVDKLQVAGSASFTGNGYFTGTGAIQLPSGTTGQQPTSPVASMVRYNTTTSRFEFYNGSAWINHVRLNGDTMTGGLTTPALIGASSSATLDSYIIGSQTPLAAYYTTISATGTITSTVATGTAPFVVASTTNVANLNASSLNGATFASPGNIGTGTAGSATFTGVTLGTTNALQWGTNAYLYGDAANTIEQYNGTNGQAYNLYNTFTNSSNYERLSMYWSGNTINLQTQQAGTGVSRNLVLGTSAGSWAFDSGGAFRPTSDASLDIGLTTRHIRHKYQTGVDVNNGTISTTVSATGTTVTIAQTTNFQVCALSASYAAMTLQFPTPLADGHSFEVVITNSVTTLTLTPNSGATVVGGPSAVTTYGAYKFRYVAAGTTWYSIV